MNGKISNPAQVASVLRYTVTEGSMKGLGVIDCTNGKIRFLINTDKACDIMQLYHEGENISFISKNGFTKREIHFLNRFEGGMLYTCGLDSVGGREGYEIHGTFHNTPAEVTRCEVGEEGIVIEATVRAAALFGKNLVMKRRITSPFGSCSVRVEDTLTNESYREEEYAILYHVNVGYPMLDAGAKIEADVLNIRPRNEWAAEDVGNAFKMQEPVPCEEERCYFLKLSKPEVSLVNKTAGKRFTLRYSDKTLPHFIEWRSMASADYALGLEPASTELDGGFAYRTLKPSESVRFFVDLTVNKI